MTLLLFAYSWTCILFGAHL